MLVLMSVTWLMAYAFDATPRRKLSVGSRTKQSPTCSICGATFRRNEHQRG